ncbi:MAG: disulfide bond formation protein B [Rubrivivax sp.]|nr:MAG: disulfide bond formation protein B [Rubrivivax sp.]
MGPRHAPASASASPRLALTLVAIACLAAVGFALFAQYQLNMQPCPWCILQRVIFLFIALLAAVGALVGGRVVTVLASVLIVASAVGGAASAWYQHFVAAKTNSCNLTLADKIVSSLHLDTALPAAFEVRASCADAASNLLGVPFEFWSLALFVVLALTGLWCALRGRA